jgi:hypothetical protein
MGKNIMSKIWIMGLLTAVSLAGCGSDGGGGAASVSAKDSGIATTGAVSTEAAAVPLGSSANYVILAKAGVATVPTSVVTGNVGLSPAAKSFLTGWSQADDVTNSYATSAQVSAPGKLYAANNTGGTTAVDLTAAVSGMETAYTNAAGRTATSAATTNLKGGAIGGEILAPGVYEFASAVGITTANLTLNGSATDVWVIKMTGALTMAAGKSVVLTGGALPKNVFWQVAGAVTIDANAHFEGIVLAKEAITFGNKASVKGRLFSQTAVNLDATTVTVP